MIKTVKRFKFCVAIHETGPHESDLDNMEKSLNAFLRRYGKRAEIRDSRRR